jgi:LysM repeat protein
MVNFAVLVVVLLFAVLLIAALRPFIFGTIVPAVFGWDQPSAPLHPFPGPQTTAPSTMATAVSTVVPEATGTQAAAATATVAPATATATPATYAVAAGDTLARIATRFGVSVDALVAANDINNPNQIQVGDQLVIPAP